MKGPGGSLGSVRKSLGQSPGEERPLDAAGEGAKPELQERARCREGNYKLLKWPGAQGRPATSQLMPGNKPLKGPGGSRKRKKKLGQSPGEERPLDAAGEGAKPELQERARCREGNYKLLKWPGAQGRPATSQLLPGKAQGWEISL